MNGLIADLVVQAGLAEAAIWHGGLVFTRVGAAVALLPVVGEQSLPPRLRLAVALAMTAIVAPAVPPMAERPGGVAFLSEMGAGLALGLSLRLMVLALQTAGTIAAQSVSLAQMFAGTGPEPQPIIATLLTLAGLAVFVGLGGVEKAVLLMVASYDLFPLGQAHDPAAFAQWGVDRISRTFALAVSLAAPFVLAALMYNLALGLINRAMPTLMVTFIGAPALSLGGLVVLALAAPLLLEIWSEAFAAVLARPFGS